MYFVIGVRVGARVGECIVISIAIKIIVGQSQKEKRRKEKRRKEKRQKGKSSRKKKRMDHKILQSN